MDNINEILEWINSLNRTTIVNINRIKLSESNYWFLDENEDIITNKNNSFFSVKAISGMLNGKEIEQPIIVQDEIGFLGIIMQIKDNIPYFLMQAKIEPGNINCVQISPTIQATKSNFTQVHGGNKPHYLDYFYNYSNYNVVYDQIQSEQSSRFFKKRNRNVIIEIDGSIDIVVFENFKWMTLKQIKLLMNYDNLVNMDTRTVISCLPLENIKFKSITDDIYNTNRELYNSIFDDNCVYERQKITSKLVDYKMFSKNKLEIKKLSEMNNWVVNDNGIIHKSKYPFKVSYFDIEIEGREVRKWNQPLFEACEIALFGLIVADFNGVLKVLTKLTVEIGCFDNVELGPTIQLNSIGDCNSNNVERLFLNHVNKKENILNDVLLSEEGGRFYHEQNRNIIVKIDKDVLVDISNEYEWLSLSTLSNLIKHNNYLNIQLRNLLSIIEI
ncbi:MAG: NDP-hexose 2,3-dehydratase family protein [Erysipelotrichaceae bacterium]